MSFQYVIAGLPDEITHEVRSTRRSPEYGHPVVEETARGTGPCRACLDVFRVGEESRLLFTYRAPGGMGTLGAPGPVFIHSRTCTRYVGNSFPPGLHSLPLFVEGRAHGNRIVMAGSADGNTIDQVLQEYLGNPAVDFIYIRHGEAGCFIARVDRTG